jgi:hypothetical protein
MSIINAFYVHFHVHFPHQAQRSMSLRRAFFSSKSMSLLSALWSSSEIRTISYDGTSTPNEKFKGVESKHVKINNGNL